MKIIALALISFSSLSFSLPTTGALSESYKELESAITSQVSEENLSELEDYILEKSEEATNQELSEEQQQQLKSKADEYISYLAKEAEKAGLNAEDISKFVEESENAGEKYLTDLLNMANQEAEKLLKEYCGENGEECQAKAEDVIGEENAKELEKQGEELLEQADKVAKDLEAEALKLLGEGVSGLAGQIESFDWDSLFGASEQAENAEAENWSFLLVLDK